MSLSDAFWIAAAFAVICAYYIGEKIIDIDFSCFLAKNAACKYGTAPQYPKRI